MRKAADLYALAESLPRVAIDQMLDHGFESDAVQRVGHSAVVREERRLRVS